MAKLWAKIHNIGNKKNFLFREKTNSDHNGK